MATNDYRQRRELPLSHLFDGTELNVYDQNVVNLSAGAPGPNLLKECCRIFQTATEHRMKHELENNAYLFQYGPTVGIYDARVAIAKFLTEGYRAAVNSADLVLTSGATHGLHLILSTLLDMSAIIFVDEVTYMIALEAFAQFTNMKVVSVPMTADGVDIEKLKASVRQYKFESQNKLFWAMYYAIPTYHNPTGILFTPETCRQLIRLARDEDFLIACDDVYNLISYDSNIDPPKRLFAYDNDDEVAADFKGNVISNGSFSKILSPGIRMGWMECPPRCTELFRNSGVLKSGGAANNYTAGVVGSMIELGLAQRQLTTYVAKYKERMLAVCAVLEECLPKSCSFLKPGGGYFVWIVFPETFNAVDFNTYCLKNHRVVAIAGSRFSAEGAFKNCLRITIAFHEKEVLVKAVTTMCEAIKLFEKLHCL